MTRPMRRFVNLKKAVIYTVVINMLQIAGSITVAVMSLITGGHAFIGLPEQVLLCTMTLLVSWGAVLDIREAFSARELASDADMLQDAYAQLEDLNGTLRAQRHDFMNHLQVVFSLLELEDYKEASDYIERVYGDIRRVSRTLKTAHPAINALLAAKVGDCEARGVHVDLQIESHWAGLPVESWEMCRVLGNLIDNALDAPAGRELKTIQVALWEYVKGFHFAVENNGAPVPEEIQDSLFQRGFSTKGPGRGMGLSIVQEILEQYGGQIDLDSTPRRTRFHGLIPYHRV